MYTCVSSAWKGHNVPPFFQGQFAISRLLLLQLRLKILQSRHYEISWLIIFFFLLDISNMGSVGSKPFYDAIDQENYAAIKELIAKVTLGIA